MPDKNMLVEITADIVSSHLANNTVAVNDVPELISKVHDALLSLSDHAAVPTEEKKAVVSVRASIKPDYLVCMECGAKQSMLKRHIQKAHGMTPVEYRRDYGLPDSYPMVSPNYSEKRRELARSSGLGRKGVSRGNSAPKQ